MAISNVKTPAGNVAGAALNGQAAESGKAQGAGAARAAAAAGYAKQAAAPTVRDAAAVQISPKAKEMSLARAVMDQTPDVREDKVAHFKKLIEAGQYKPDAGRIADGILGEAIKDELSKKPETALE